MFSSLVGLYSVRHMTGRIFLHFVECCQHIEFCTYQVQQLYTVIIKIFPELSVFEDREARFKTRGR